MATHTPTRVDLLPRVDPGDDLSLVGVQNVGDQARTVLTEFGVFAEMVTAATAAATKTGQDRTAVEQSAAAVNDDRQAVATMKGVVDTKHAEALANAATVATNKDTAVAAAAVAAPALGLLADSSTSHSVATGDKTFTVPAGKSFAAGMPLRVSSKANPDTQFMTGVVKSYSGTTLVFTAQAVTGSATRTDWLIAVTSGALAPVGATQDAQAIARYAERMDALRAAAVPDRPNLLLDFLEGTFFVRNAFIGESLAALIAALPGSSFTRASTATYIGSDGLMKTAAVNEPRFDYDPLTKLPLGLLFEASSTNLAFPLNASGTAPPSYTADGMAAPTGSTTDLVLVSGANDTASAAGTRSNLSRNVDVQANVTYGFPLYVRKKPGGARGVRMLAFMPTGGGNTVVASVADTNSAFVNGWYRLWNTFTSTIEGTVAIRVGDIDSTGGEFYAWRNGLQVEVGSVPSSLIFTGSSAVTRAADVFSLVLPSGLLTTEGTVFVEHDGPGGASFVDLRLADAGGTNFLYLRRHASGAAQLFSTVAGVAAVNGLPLGTLPAGPGIIAVAYKAGDYAGSAGGRAAVASSAANAPSGMTRLTLSVPTGLTMRVRRIGIFPTRLANAKLQALTTDAPWS